MNFFLLLEHEKAIGLLSFLQFLKQSKDFHCWSLAEGMYYRLSLFCQNKLHLDLLQGQPNLKDIWHWLYHQSYISDQKQSSLNIALHFYQFVVFKGIDRYLMNGTPKSVVHMIKYTNFQLYRYTLTGLFRKLDNWRQIYKQTSLTFRKNY